MVPPIETNANEAVEAGAEDTSLLTRPPSVERRHVAAAEARTPEAPSHLAQLACMRLPVGRQRDSGLDEVRQDEYARYFVSGIELLDEIELQRMKRAKLRGASNLFDVPREFTDPPVSITTTELVYRSTETIRGLLNQTPRKEPTF